MGGPHLGSCLSLLIKFYWKTALPLHLWIICISFHAVMAEFGVCNRDPEAYKAETISYPVLDKEELNDLRWTDEAASTELGHSPGCDLRRRSSPCRINLNSRSLWPPFSADLKKKCLFILGCIGSLSLCFLWLR